MSTERGRTWGNGQGRLGKVARRISERVGTADPERLLLAEMLKDSADLADSSRNQQDRASYVAATMRMLQLMKALGIGGVTSGDSDDDASPADRLAGLVGAGPAVGDQTQA